MVRFMTAAAVGVCVFASVAHCQPPDEPFRDALARYTLAMTPRLAAAVGPSGDADPAVRSDVPPQPTFLALGRQLAETPQASETRPAEAQTQPGKGQFVPWRKRRGPAYPGDFWRSFGRDAKELLPTVWDDTKATFTNTASLLGFGLAIASAVAIDMAGWNGCVADHFHKNGSQLNDFWDSVGDVGGNPGTHFAVAGAMYFTSLAGNHTKTYEVSKTLINALSINGITTLAGKAIAQSRSPNGDSHGWPSGHTSSTFCFATVMYEAYGPWVGVPLMGFAAFVGYERIDAENHDFNDVISGALIGIAIGHAVSKNHQARIFGFDVMPYADPRGAAGVALTKKW